MNNDTSKYIPLAVIIIGLLATYGTAPTAAKTTVSAYEIEQAKTAAPFAAAMLQPGNNQPEPEPFECKCGGTGRSGDGLGPCGCEDCKCEKTGSVKTPRKDKITYEFTAPWCGVCSQHHGAWDAKYTKRGWDVGPNGKHIKHIDINTPEGRALADKYNIGPIPAWVHVEDGQELRRATHWTDDWDQWWLWSGEGRDRKPSDIAPTLKRRNDNARTNQNAQPAVGRGKIQRQTGRRYSRSR